MFESGKRQTNKKPTTTGNEVCKLPTPEQIFELWELHFEPLLKSSDNHNATLLEEFENDILQYVKTKTIEI